MLNNAILLAGGNSTRFGKNKILEPIFNGECLLDYHINFLVENGIKNVYVTLNSNGPHIQIITKLLSHPLATSINFKFGFQDKIEYGTLSAIKVWKDTIKTNNTLILFGDNFYKGKINLELKETSITFSKLTKNESNLRFSYINDKSEIIEKPHSHIEGKFFTGFIFLKKQEIDFSLYEKSERGEYEITHFLNHIVPDLIHINNTGIVWSELTYFEDIYTLQNLIEKYDR